ncbi:MAG TPA: preprotein translocase subunit SecA [Candidatus Binatus sp.]|uniref:preprotein translocase subunit SecA n=1 Tax=Candidatus Binatus sp. TaxID=2811406 RepID=UPI002B499192|nr:preprotein translocase subunit SecA [Candidatus Binatus sp.]HKN12200.1 preprotein translocase subunit SecA [Candidatus Binatus sp.]
MASAFSLVARKIFGSKNEREIKRLRPDVDEINRLEPEISALNDDALRAKIAEWKASISAIEEREQRDEAMLEILPQVFAVVREASKRTIGQRHFDVQLIGGMILHQGRIAEMKTGEGKTLVATLPAVLNALSGRGVHVVTVNDYLARRDSEWMGRIYSFLGLTVGVVVHGLTDQERKVAYRADITYGQNNEFGFDYLRDNMKFNIEDYVQREHNFAIVDEVDSILIDEARTPLIISGASEESTDTYYVVDRVIPRLKPEEHYTIDEKMRTVALTEDGVTRVEQLLGVENLYDPRNILLLHHANQGLRAHTLFKRDVDYVVKEGEVIIVDEFTGRLMPGRRWSDGLHQAVEAKENVKIESENQTLATITFQNYFRMYKKLSGMTGTADTEAVEFKEIYHLDVVVIPTNQPMIRIDNHDVVYKTEVEKFDAVIEEIADCHERGQPVLVGTVSIEKSERVADKLKKTGIKHYVLNAKNHEREAEIVAQAGRFGAVTISTNMAGRGTDIVLGGNPEFMAAADAGTKEPTDPNFRAALAKYVEQCKAEREKVLEAGGLHILGTERHESRRIDNQLRGRSGRQGDPGSSRFYMSLEDDLLRIFGADRLKGLMGRIGMEDNEPIEHRWISRAIENAQKKVEAHNFDIRKHLLEYDDVMNKQREVVYHRRRELLSGASLKADVLDMCDALIEEIAAAHGNNEIDPAEWDWKAIDDAFFKQFKFRPGFSAQIEVGGNPIHGSDDLIEIGSERVHQLYDQRETEFTEPVMRQIEKIVMLQTLDSLWKDHLLAMDHLKEGIGLRGYAQVNPLVEYQKEGFTMFEALMAVMQQDVVEKVFSVQVQRQQDVEQIQQPKPQRVVMSHGGETEVPPAATPVKREAEKVGRNDPCPCGSGKKYKRCHGK